MLVCIVLLIGLVTLFACNKSDVADKDGQTKVIVKIQDEDGSIYKENVVFSDLFTLSLQKEGYTGRLYRDADFLKPLTKDSKVKNGDTVYVKWTINKYTVTFMDGEKVLATFPNVRHGDTVTAPEVPKKDGKTFKEWDKGFSTVTSDLTINAVYDVDKFTLMFINFDGTTVYTEEVEYGASIEDAYNNAVEKVDIEGPFEYDGWYEVGDETTTLLDENNLPEMPARNVTYKLKLKLTLSAIGDNTAITVPGGFTYGEKSATFTVSGDTHDGVNYEYEWTILKDGKEYKKQTTTSGSITIENPDAGTYVASVKVVASKEGCGSVEKDFSAGETLIVSRADISGITVTGGTFTYGDENAKIKIDGLKDGDKVFYGKDGVSFSSEIVDFSKCDVGEYKYSVKVVRNENFNEFTSDVVTINVTKAAVTIRFSPNKKELVYGDDLPALTAYVGNKIIGTVDKGNYFLKLGEIAFSEKAVNVGEYAVEVKGFTNDYYNDKNFDVTFLSSDKITISRAKLVVKTLAAADIVYGNDLPEIGYEITGWKNGDEKTEYTLVPTTEYNKKSSVGPYSFSYGISGERIKYYDTETNVVSFNVTKRAAEIIINDVKDIVYGDEEPKLSAKVKNVLDGDTLSYTLKTDYSAKKKPGGYNAFVEIKEGDNSNYNVSVVNKTFTVLKKELTITLGSKRVAAGKEYKVDAASLTIDGLLADDTVTGYVTITKTEAGVYTANDFDKTNLKFDSECYKVIKYDLTVEFVKVDFKIHFADKEVDYNGQNHNVSVTADDGTNYTITYGTKKGIYDLTDAPSYKNAGEYVTYFKVVDNSLDDGSEYEDEIKLTVKKAEVEIKIGTYTMTYGNELPEFSYEATGLLNGDTLSGEAQYIVEGMTDGNVGTYKVKVGGLSANDNYAITVVPGTLTINQKSIAVVWSTKDKYVYSPDGQEMPTATYDGRSAKVTTNGEFKNAGTYTFTATDESGNYTLTNAVLNVVIEKATYSGIVHDALSGVYNPAKTLKDYALAEGFTWVDASEKPVCTKNEKGYAAIYNADSDNYENFELNIAIVLQKAEVALKDGVVGFDYDGTSHEIKAVVTYNGVALDTSLYSLTYDGKTSKTYTDAGTHACLIEISADNYDLPENTYVYVKVKGVKVGNNYYTIEDALDVAASGQTIFVLNDTAFATQEIAGVLYDDVKFKTVKTGVTLLLPFNENDTVGHIGAGGKRSANYKATAALTGIAKLYKTLVIPEGIEVIVNGKLIVGAQTGKIDAGGVQNAVSGNYCEISLGGTITLNNATLEVYGYIKGNGEITANNTTVIENLCITGWLGGSESAGRYIGDGKLLTSSTNVNNPVQFPFSHYELRSVQLSITLHKGSKHQGYAKIATGDSLGGLIAAQINEAWLTFVSSDSNESSGLVRMKSSDAKVVKTFKGGRVGIETYGSMEDGYTSVTLEVGVTISMTSEKVFFPICGKTDIVIKSGTFTQKHKYKLMPGSTLTIENGATLNQNGSIVVYTGDFKDVTDTHYPSGLGDAKFTVDGTLNINGAFGGKVLSTTAGKVVVGANATITDVYSPEGKGGVSKLTTSYTPLDKTMTTKSLVFVNAGNSTVAAATNKTYNYNNGTWQ